MSRAVDGFLLGLVALLAAGELQAQTCNPNLSEGDYCDEDGITLHYCGSDGLGGGVMTTFDCSGAAGGACGNSWDCASGSTGCFTTPGCIGQTAGDYCDVAVLVDQEPGYYWGCGGGLSCVLGAVPGGLGQTCASFTTPTVCSDGETHKGCVDGIATRCYSFGPGFTLANVFGTRCSHLSTTCVLDDADGMPVCQMGLGDPCWGGDYLYGETVRCAPGLVCAGESPTALGTCVDPTVDGGVPDAGGLSGSDGGPLVDAGGAASDGGGAALDGGGGAVDAGSANDSGTSQADAGGNGGNVFDNQCGDLDARGACDGDVLRWCQAGRPAERSCADEGLVCAEVGVAVGFDCVAAEGAGSDDSSAFDCACVAMTGKAPAAAALLFGGLGLLLRRRRRRR